ncbi:chromosome assembly protein, partial [Reticulomyxa filosa]
FLVTFCHVHPWRLKCRLEVNALNTACASLVWGHITQIGNGNAAKTTQDNDAEETEQLQALLGEQTVILKEQIKKYDDLQNILQSVLTDYSQKINISNAQIKDLNEQMLQQTSDHQKQVQDLKMMYEKELINLKLKCIVCDKSKDEAYKQEIHELVQTLSEVRNNFRIQIEDLAKQMQTNQKSHEIEALQLSGTIQELTTDLQEARTSIGRLMRINNALTQRMKSAGIMIEKAIRRKKHQDYQDTLDSL